MFEALKKKLLLTVNQQSSFYIISFALCYLLLGRLSIYANAIGTIVAPALFLPAGLSLLMAFLLNRQFWISIFVGEYMISWSLDLPWGVSVALALANTLSFLLTIKLIDRWRINPTHLSNKTFWLQNWLIIITQVLSAVIANLALYINDPSAPSNVAISQTLSWFLSNVLTQTLILPIGLSILLQKSLISATELIVLVALLCFTYFFTSLELGNPVIVSILTLTLLTLIATKSNNLTSLSLLGLVYISWNLFVHHQGIFGAEAVTMNSLTTLLISITWILQFVSHLSESLKNEKLLKKELIARLSELKITLNERRLLALGAILQKADDFLQSGEAPDTTRQKNFSLQSKYARLVRAEAHLPKAFDHVFILYFLIKMLRFNATKTYVPFKNEPHSNQTKTLNFIAQCLENETGELAEVHKRYLNHVSNAENFDIHRSPEIEIIDIVEEFYLLTEHHGMSISKAIRSIKAGSNVNAHNHQLVNAFEGCLGDILITRGFSDTESQSITAEYTHEDNIDEAMGSVYPSSDYLFESDHVYKTLFNSSSLGLALVDFETGHFLEVNKALLTMTGYEKDEFLGKTFWDITPRNYADQEERQLTALTRTGKFGPNEKEYIRKDGTTFHISIEGVITTHQNKKCVWGVIQDLTKTKSIAELSEKKISKDFLTGLANRYLWEERVSQAMSLASRNKSTVSLILIDLDKFKLINDNYGHQVGDEVLIEFSNRLNKLIKRKSDTAARLGGDEFAILLPETHRDDVIIIAERILKLVALKMTVEKIEINISCSMGICSTDDSGYDEKKLFAMADSALLQAKKSGRSQYKVWS